MLDNDHWFTNFPNYLKLDNGELLFSVSGTRQFGRWMGFIFSAGISSAAEGNRLSEMSIKVEGGDSEPILREFIAEYERNRNSITPSMIKNTIKRNNWYVVEYNNNARLRVCSSGFRVHIRIRKNP